MTQFSIHWILSLNELSHSWGQVQTSVIYIFFLTVVRVPSSAEMGQSETGSKVHI